MARLRFPQSFAGVEPKAESAVGRRIAFVTPQHFGADGYIGGGERYPLNLARGLLAADPSLQIDLIATGDPRDALLEPGLTIRVLPISDRGATAHDDVSAALAGALGDADLVHVHQAFLRPSMVAILVAKFLGKPVVVTDHGAGAPDVERVVGYSQLVDLFVFQSRFAAGCIAGGRRRCTIPGGVDDRFFRPPTEPRERGYILCVARLVAFKGIDRLICAVPADVPLVVVGRSHYPYDPGYAGYLRALAGGRDVRFVEDADDLTLRELYQGAWASVTPSVQLDVYGHAYEKAPELMGIAALESMACGTPTLVSPTGALPEFVRDGETGFVCDGLAELGARCTALASGELDSGRLGAAARALVEAEYSIDVVGRKLLGAYDELLEGSA